MYNYLYLRHFETFRSIILGNVNVWPPRGSVRIAPRHKTLAVMVYCVNKNGCPAIWRKQIFCQLGWTKEICSAVSCQAPSFRLLLRQKTAFPQSLRPTPSLKYGWYPSIKMFTFQFWYSRKAMYILSYRFHCVPNVAIILVLISNCMPVGLQVLTGVHYIVPTSIYNSAQAGMINLSKIFLTLLLRFLQLVS